MKLRDGFTVCEKKTMLLSVETAAGLKLTGTYNVMYVLYVFVLYTVAVFYAVMSFVELARYVLSLPGAPPLLSRRLTQDPLEKYFGLQRQRGRVNENPNSQEFYKNSQALRVVQACSTSIKGNCRGNTDVDASELLPLKRRKSHS